jgi:hypothetical protein
LRRRAGAIDAPPPVVALNQRTKSRHTQVTVRP